jgi:hypothetical protein
MVTAIPFAKNAFKKIFTTTCRNQLFLISAQISRQC